MSTELGAFAVLSSLLLYLTDLVSSHPQNKSNKAKWKESIVNKANVKREFQSPHSGIRPTKFQLLQSRFLNNNREPYRKKRDVGKLNIKEKQTADRNGLNSIASKLDRNSLTEGESPTIMLQEKAKWVSCCGKNTVKNVLKKFLAAEEKAAKENQSTPKMKVSSNNRPKIINKNSVLSILKEKFEQTSNVCSAIDVKKFLPRKGEKKNKKSPEKKTICKAEIRLFQMELRTATNIHNCQPQHLVCTTVPMPKFCVATEISHPWSWATNAKPITQLSDQNPEEEGTKDIQNIHDIQLDENKKLRSVVQEGQQIGQLQNNSHDIAMSVTEKKSIAETDGMSARPDSAQDSVPASEESVSLISPTPTLPRNSLDHKDNVLTLANNTFSNSRDENESQTISKENFPATCLSSSPTEGFHVHSHQEIKGNKIPGIPESMCGPKETEIELTEPIKDLPFAGQKCFPEQKVLENIPPFQSPGAQASCNIESPVTDLQSSTEPAAVNKMPQLNPSQESAKALKRKFSDTVQNKEKHFDKEEICSNANKSDHASQAKQEEAKAVKSQGDSSDQMEPFHQKTVSQQNSQANSNQNISKQIVNQACESSTSNDRQKENNDEKGGYICHNFEKQHTSFSGVLEKSSCITAIENIDNDKLCSVNVMTNPEPNREKENITVSHLEASQSLLKEIISHETHGLVEIPGPFSEKCNSSLLNHSAKPENNVAEISSPCCGIGTLQAPLPKELSKNESCIQEDRKARHSSEKHYISSLSEMPKAEDTPGQDEKTSDNLHSDLIKNENNAAENKDILPRIPEKKSQPNSTTDIKRNEISPTGQANSIRNVENQEMSIANETGEQENTQVMMDEKKLGKSTFPSQNEAVIQGSSAARKGVQCLMSSAVNRREQDDQKAEEKSSWEEGKKAGHSSKVPENLIKSDLTKDGGGKTGEKITQRWSITPPKQKPSCPGLLHSTDHSAYQTSARNLTKHDGGGSSSSGDTGGDKTTVKPQHPSCKEPMKNDTNAEGENAKGALKDDSIPLSLLSDDKVKLEVKTGRSREKSSTSGQNQLACENETTKSKKDTGREGDSLGHLKKDKMQSSKEQNTEPKNLPIGKTQRPPSNDCRNPKVIAKDERNTLWNAKKDQLPLSKVKSESQQNNVIAGKEQQQQPQAPKDCIKPKSVVRDEKHMHCDSKKYIPASSDDLEMDGSNGSRKIGSSKNVDKQRTPQLSQGRTSHQEKAACKTDAAGPHLDSTNEIHPTEQRKTKHSSGKYKILAAHDLSGPESGDTKKYEAGVVKESTARLVGLEKYKAESYSEGPINSSFKPMVIRVIDTIKLDD